MALSLHPDGHVTTREQQGGGRGWTRTRGRRRGPCLRGQILTLGIMEPCCGFEE